MANTRKRRSSDPLASAALALGTLDLAGRTLSVGLSGGVDSVALLKLLLALRPRFGYSLDVIHVNHGLSPHANKWEAFCAELCRKWRVPLAIERVRVPADDKKGKGVEAAARLQRYGAFARHAKEALVLAHHLDDQAETLLLQLLRGAGVRGLAAMREVSLRSPQVQVPVLRPLLRVTRADIERYARRERLKWVEDESNDLTAYSRNFLRHRVLPALEQLFPSYRETLARSAAHCAEAADMLEETGVLDAGLARDVTKLDCARLRELPPARAANALRTFLALNGLLAPDSAKLAEMLRQLLGAKSDAGVTLEHDGAVLRRYRDWLWIAGADQGKRATVIWNGDAVLELGAPSTGSTADSAGALLFRRRGPGVRIAAGKMIPGQVSVRARKGGEKLKPDAKRPRRSLKNLLQESAMPPWERDALPLLYCGSALAWVPGIGVDCAFQPAPGEAAWFVSWRPLHYTRTHKNTAPRRRNSG
jgi:tRNA(Ile)-lysidine synthase